ncbi:MAG: hypothetical protein H8E39_00515 [Alphaproteobacteria bacterium]|nr:hypothetical protein [Alphaproteobacteria bacterium]
MSRQRYSPRSFRQTPSAPFLNAEEAWFWFIRCQKARADGARFEAGMGAMVRPCDPDDLYRAVRHLERKRRITPDHIKTLNDFGRQERPPDPRCREEERPSRLWDEALDKLSTVLKNKGIIE